MGYSVLGTKHNHVRICNEYFNIDDNDKMLITYPDKDGIQHGKHSNSPVERLKKMKPSVLSEFSDQDLLAVFHDDTCCGNTANTHTERETKASKAR